MGNPRDTLSELLKPDPAQQLVSKLEAEYQNVFKQLSDDMKYVYNGELPPSFAPRMSRHPLSGARFVYSTMETISKKDTVLMEQLDEIKKKIKRVEENPSLYQRSEFIRCPNCGALYERDADICLFCRSPRVY